MTVSKSLSQQSRSRNLDFVSTPPSSPKSLNRDQEICRDMKFLIKSWQTILISISDEHRGRGGAGGGTLCTSYKDFWKLPHKDAIKTTPPLIVSQPQVPPSKEFAKKTQGPPPLDFQLLCIYDLNWELVNFIIFLNKDFLFCQDFWNWSP